jgi:group II intron reverse transcriptase/maturase
MTHGTGRSDGPVVPEKLPNKAGLSAAEAVEGRGPAKGNASQQNVLRTQRRDGTPSALDRVRQVARKDRNAKFTALFHHLTLDRLRDAFLALQRKAAAGIDGVTWAQYADGLEDHLRDLHARLHRNAYRAKASRQVFIPKADGRQRPLGIASLEDKIVQGAVVEILNAIYEVDFLGFSYGFRPGRNQHQALDALAVTIVRKRVNWVLDMDVRDFYGSIDHGWLLTFLGHRIQDRRILRLIQKWLGAGILQDGVWSVSERGTPQGATVSCLLANVYLHYAMDLWVRQWRTRHATGEVFVVRYADDAVVGFERGHDALRFQRELRERLRRFALELHPIKTRLIRFGRFAATDRAACGEGKPETFTFLGFTHICGKSQAGRFVLVRHTSGARMRAKLQSLKRELQLRWHQSIPEQGQWLGSVVRGYLAYHAVPTNQRRIRAFRTQVARLWLRALRRRGQRDRTNWQRMRGYQDRWLPPAQIQHPWPEQRFDVRTQGKSPVR